MEDPPIAQSDCVADVPEPPFTVRAELVRAWPQGLAYWAAGSIPVFLAVLWVYGTEPPGLSLLDRFARWDGEQYVAICTRGYTYHPDHPTEVVFFPAYPLLARPLLFFGLSPTAALLVVTHLCLAASFVVLTAYLRRRYPAEPVLIHFILAALAFAPIGFFFRMAYSESLFLLLTLLCFYAMQRGADPSRIAILVGVATATRPTALALVPPVLLYVWRRSPTVKNFWFQVAGLAPFLAWGLLGYSAYLAAAFDAPLAFGRIQDIWWRIPGRAAADKWVALLMLEPFWAPVDSGSPCYWDTRAPGLNPWLDFYLVNPVAFAAAVAMTAVGAWRGWLNRTEAWLASGLLLVAYLGKSYEMCMLSGARYASVAFPIYMVAGRLLWLIPQPLAYALLALAAAGLVYGSVGFALGRWCFF